MVFKTALFIPVFRNAWRGFAACRFVKSHMTSVYINMNQNNLRMNNSRLFHFRHNLLQEN